MKYKYLTEDEHIKQLNSGTIGGTELYKSSKCQFREINLG